MATLRELRSRIRSVENTKQITKAMEMVAAARLRRAQTQAEQAVPYALKMKQILENLAGVSAHFAHPLYQQREVKKLGLVVVTADRGLCGSFNTNLLTAADRFLKNYQPEQVELILIGKKGNDYYRRRKRKTLHRIPEWGGKITFAEIKSLTSQLMDWFLQGELDEIWLIYTHFISLVSRKVMTEKFLNIERPKAEARQVSSDYIFEPDPEEIYFQILPRWCVTKMQTVLAESYASELAARMLAMGAATKNAKEMIENLTLVRNKARQSQITKEMLEITAGAEALR
ncbi:MAG: ATP synthase F1 subunit gamma [candidate division Zixibacteria bacterium]|nr:ATP synthase F1 subunit gamma [candidate division Zixibacteria bacterium]